MRGLNQGVVIAMLDDGAGPASLSASKTMGREAQGSHAEGRAPRDPHPLKETWVPKLGASSAQSVGRHAAPRAYRFHRWLWGLPTSNRGWSVG